MALIDNLISYWKLDEASGTRNDSHSTNNLTDNNTVTSTTGKINSAGQFVAANTEYLSITDNASLSTTGAFTLAAWCQFPSLPGGSSFPGVIGKWGGGGQNEYILYYDGSTQKFSLAVTPNGSSATVVAAASTSTATNTWFYVAGKYDGTNIGVSINGGAFNTASYSSGIFDGTSEFRIGRPDASGTPWDGLIDECAFWKRALSDAEISELYNSGAGLAYPFSAVASDVGFLTPKSGTWGP